MSAASDDEQRDGRLAGEDRQHDRAIDEAVGKRIEHREFPLAAQASCARALSEGFEATVSGPLTTTI